MQQSVCNGWPKSPVSFPTRGVDIVDTLPEVENVGGRAKFRAMSENLYGKPVSI